MLLGPSYFSSMLSSTSRVKISPGTKKRTLYYISLIYRLVKFLNDGCLMHPYQQNKVIVLCNSRNTMRRWKTLCLKYSFLSRTINANKTHTQIQVLFVSESFDCTTWTKSTRKNFQMLCNTSSIAFKVLLQKFGHQPKAYQIFEVFAWINAIFIMSISRLQQ